MKNVKQILETLRMQPLSDEEKKSRHILGRLYGPIATCEESTRNGRKYNRELWEKALSDEVFKEKIANKSLFLELGHPADREETDMEKVCACIPELPKIVDGDLYAYVDILDTNNGRLLKTLCDYGFVPGISSRGSGDVMPNDEVDPETFFLETWDIVQLPAVKKARLQMCESLDVESLNMKKALRESYDVASEEEKRDMKEALDRLDISLTEGEKQSVSLEDIPFEDPDSCDVLHEDGNEIEDEAAIEGEEAAKSEEKEEESAEEKEDLTKVQIPLDVAIDAVKSVVDNVKDAIDASKKEEKKIDEVGDDAADKLTELAGEQEAADGDDESAEDIKEDELPEEEAVEAESEGEDKENEEPTDEAEKQAEEAETEEAGDPGLEETLSCLKDALRQKDALAEENKKLKESKAVSDAEAKRLNEQLSECQAALEKARGSEIDASEFEERIEELTEHLKANNEELESMREKRIENERLTESANESARKAKRLTEKLDEMQKELSKAEDELRESKSQGRKKLSEAVEIAKIYKERYGKLMEHYVETKASLLGVRPTDIKAKLKENFSEKDVDDVCDELMEAPQYFSNSLFSGIMNGSSVKINESAEPKKKDISEGYDIDENLLIMAGLK